MLLAVGEAGRARCGHRFLPPSGSAGVCSDPSPYDSGGSGECLVGELKMFCLLLVDLMNGPWDLQALSALARSLPSFPSHLLDKRTGEVWLPCLLLFLSEKLVPSHCRVPITQ